MYKNKLFLNGLKFLLKNKGSLKSYKKNKSKSGGSLNSLDDYLLSLVNGVSRMTTTQPPKPSKFMKKTYGGALKFVR